jgi:hypothetical protein
VLRQGVGQGGTFIYRVTDLGKNPLQSGVGTLFYERGQGVNEWDTGIQEGGKLPGDDMDFIRVASCLVMIWISSDLMRSKNETLEKPFFLLLRPLLMLSRMETGYFPELLSLLRALFALSASISPLHDLPF